MVKSNKNCKGMMLFSGKDTLSKSATCLWIIGFRSGYFAVKDSPHADYPISHKLMIMYRSGHKQNIIRHALEKRNEIESVEIFRRSRGQK